MHLDEDVISSRGRLGTLCQRHPDCEYFMLVESTNERAVYETVATFPTR